MLVTNIEAMNLDNKIIIAYHQVKPGTDCPDGICAAWIAASYYGYQNVELAPLIHSNDADYTSDFVIPFDYVRRHIVMLDFTYNQFLMDKIANSAASLLVLDHHEPRAGILENISNLENTVLGKYSPNEKDCGATLTWKHFFADELEPWFLLHVWRRDTGVDGYYDGDTPYSEKIANAMSALRTKTGVEAFPIFDLLQSFDDEQVKILEKIGENTLVERDKLCNEEIEYWNQNQKFTEIINYSPTLDVPVVYKVPFLKIQNKQCDKYYSWVGTLLARQYKKLFVVIQATTTDTELSLRSHSLSKINLGELAKANGGGGHFHAAGFTLK